MDEIKNQTPSPDDNKLGLTDQNEINKYEAKGIAAAELFVFTLDSEIQVSTILICKIHQIAFKELYDWAGKWRSIEVVVGQLLPPHPKDVLQLMYQFIHNLNYKIENAVSLSDYVDTLTYAHYEFIRIHPFNNGNGRTGRIFMNLIALKFGFRPLELYHRKGEGRKVYIEALREADKGNFDLLTSLVRKELTAF